MLLCMTTSTSPPNLVEAFVGSTDVPLAAVDLPSGRFLAVNPPMAKALSSTVDALTGSSTLEQLPPADRPAAQLGFQALADGTLTSYQAFRRLAASSDPGQAYSVWVSAIDVGGTRVGLVSLTPAADHDSQLEALPPLSRAPELGHVVLGTVDGAWRIDRISQDVTPVLGITLEQCVGAPVLAVVHPSDAPALLAAVEHARRGERAVRLTLRLSGGSRAWITVTAVLATISPGNPPALAFALIRGDASPAGDGPAGGGRRELQLETHMLRIADELRAAGLIPRLDQLPVLTETPKLGELTSREWAVLTRLLDGQRVSAIAADMFLSQSTVRNHLSSIYAKLGVHSQVDLIRLIRRGAKDA
jgi:DNA-binding CsgD family transcriptional regulator